jgi:hypothetical protein
VSTWMDHPLHCECLECVARDPLYARRRGTARSLINRLARRGGSFRLVGGKVRYRPVSEATDEERTQMRRVKDELYELIRKDDAARRVDEGNSATVSPLPQVASFDLQDAG